MRARRITRSHQRRLLLGLQQRTEALVLKPPKVHRRLHRDTELQKAFDGDNDSKRALELLHLRPYADVDDGFHSFVYRVAPGVAMKCVVYAALDLRCRAMAREAYHATLAGIHGVGPRVYAAENTVASQSLTMQELTGYESVGRHLGVEYDDCETRSRYRTNTRAFPRAEVARAFAKLHALKVTHGDPSLNNIMLHPRTRDVKLVDYAYARYERRGDRAAEFANVEWESIERQAREADAMSVRAKRCVRNSPRA